MPIPILLLVALPASGKSELRRYLDHLDPSGRDELGLGDIIQLDDYPYVALMRSISRVMKGMGVAPAFFATDEDPFTDPRDWLTLIHLLNEDHAALIDGFSVPGEPGRWLLDRFDRARLAAGAPPLTNGLAPSIRSALTSRCEAPGSAIANDLAGLHWTERSTIVIEFARGGPQGSTPPLPHPYGYQHSLTSLSPDILARASALYVRVTPEQSRAKNRERAHPDGEGSILFHGVPEAVMRREYGTDDFVWLVETSDRPGTIQIDGFFLPAAVFDNRTDHTTFLRDDPAAWPTEEVTALHTGLRRALAELSTQPRR
jgi:hypothetical protein